MYSGMRVFQSLFLMLFNLYKTIKCSFSEPENGSSAKRYLCSMSVLPFLRPLGRGGRSVTRVPRQACSSSSREHSPGVPWSPLEGKKSAFITTSSNTRGSSRNLRSCFYIHCLIIITQAIFVQEICVILVALPNLRLVICLKSYFIFHSLPVSSKRTCITAGSWREKET